MYMGSIAYEPPESKHYVYIVHTWSESDASIIIEPDSWFSCPEESLEPDVLRGVNMDLFEEIIRGESD